MGDRSRATINTITGDNYGVSDLSVTGDGKRIVGANANHIKIWDAVDGNELWTLLAGAHRNLKPAVTLAPDESFIAVGTSDGRIQLLDTKATADTRYLAGLAESAAEMRVWWRWRTSGRRGGNRLTWDLTSLRPAESAGTQRLCAFATFA
ncbi:MAG: WD40 repeat domain-containing protein [Planctomycetaceae bacterium]